MDLTTAIVLLLTAVAIVVLVLFERNSRQNEAKLKTEAAAKVSAALQSDHAP